MREDIDWPAIHRLRKRIERLEAALVPLYEQRADTMAAMADADMGQREIGAYWRVAQPRVSQILKRRARA